MRLAELPIADDWDDWKDALGLTARRAPEVYSDAGEVGDVPHAGPIRTALRDLGADSVFCIEDVPTAVFFAAEDADASHIAPLHSALWNQGLASVLAVVCGEPSASTRWQRDRKTGEATAWTTTASSRF